MSYTLTLNYRKNNTFSETSALLHFFENNVSSHEYSENTYSKPVKNDIITMNGFSYSNDSMHDFLSVFKKQKALAGF